MEELKRPEAVAAAASLPEPYAAPELYDMVFDRFEFDLEFWRGALRECGGPALEVGCGTGRVMLPLMREGLDCDGVDLHAPMLERLRAKAVAAGLKPRLMQASMSDFTMPRRYRTIFCGFNSFAHNLTTDDQIATLRCCREHLEPGGVFILHLSLPPPSMWLQPDAEPVLELEAAHPETGLPIRMYDTRRKNWVDQSQHSTMEIQELDAAGAVARSHRFETRQRWIYPHELALLLTLAGFSRWSVYGGLDRRPLGPDAHDTVTFAWRD
jgi:SAM-dependent methyltransferase